MHQHRAINLDANASYGVLPEVIEGLGESLGALNPSSIHAGGQRARAAIELARDRIAALLGLKRGERIVFTSGATEANTTAILAPFLGREKVGDENHPVWVTSTLEHHSVLEPCARLHALGYRGKALETPRGFLSPDAIEGVVSSQTELFTAMYANNETGHITPIHDLVGAVRARSDCRIHIDAVQLLGKSPVHLFDYPIDSASFSAHKIGGLPGVGALVVREDRRFTPLLVGGSQELRHRAGTENVAGIVSFGIAAQSVHRELSARIERMSTARRFLESEISRAIPEARYNHPIEGGLPNTLSITVPGIRADDLVVALDLAGVLISSGAACASGKPEPSHVLKALGLSDELARATIRLSLRADHTTEELSRAVEALTRAVRAGGTR